MQTVVRVLVMTFRSAFSREPHPLENVAATLAVSMAALVNNQLSVYSGACSRSPGCACPLCDMSANALLCATPQQKENRPPALPSKETRRKQQPPQSARPVVPAKVGAMPLQPHRGLPTWFHFDHRVGSTVGDFYRHMMTLSIDR